MARVFFLAFDEAGHYPLVKRLRNAGHKMIVAQPKYPEFVDLLRQQPHPPEVFVADLGMRPSHVREALGYLRGLKAHKETPFLLFRVKPEDEAKNREKVPGAIQIPSDDVEVALDDLLKAKGAAPA